MRNKALYFPYINLPENDWLYLMLLYWERLSAIVPSEYVYDRRKLSPHMSTLMEEGLVDFIEPQKFIENRDEFGKPFIGFIEKRVRTGRIPLRENVAQRFPVHVEKLGPVAAELVSMNLATEADYPWYEMDIWVADAFMAYLASFLGSLPEINSAPVTNNEICFRLLGGYPRKVIRERTVQRYEILRNILPFPIGELNLDRVIKFKDKYLEELSRFRDQIESLSIDLSNITDPKEREEKRDITIRGLKQEIDFIASHMGETWHEIAFLDVLPILSTSGSVLAGIQATEPLTTGLGAVSLSAAIYQSIERRRNRQVLRNHPLAYGALLNREWLRLKKGGGL
ncbi:hypothetical protein ACFLT8_05760 [Chloroflexota bacterium]